jgi:hypothetical protein
VTDRARVDSLPDETPVEDLPLRQVTINRLRVGGVLTLGDLRATPDRELLRLRRFGRYALADVRALVPVPAATPGSEVTIAGRSFLLGAAYAPRRDGRGRPFKPRRLLEYSADGLLPGGRVRVAMPDCRRLLIGGEEWAAWAGEPVGDVGR